MSTKKKPLIVIFFTVFIDLIGFGIIIPLSPYLASEFGADALQVGLLMTVYSGAQFLFSPLWGQLSDKFGRRPIILMSLVGAGVAHLIFAMAQTYWLLFAARLFAGVFGANISTAMAYIADITEEKDRSKNMGLVGAAFGLGFVLGPALGALFGWVGELLGTAPPFGKSFAAVVASAICLANAAVAWRVLKESLPMGKRGMRERKPRFEMIMIHLKRPVVGQLQVMYFLASFAMAHMEASLFLFVQDDFQWSLTKAGLGFAYVGVIMVITQGYLIRKLLPKIGEKRMLMSGLVMKAAGLSGIALSGQIWGLAVAVTLLGLGTGFINPALSGSISLLTPEDQQGGVMGVNQSLSALGRIVGPVLGGWFYRDITHQTPFWAGAMIVVVSLLIGLSVFTRLPVRAQEGR
ncbi:MAG: MFS transporter [Bdellovibrionaceae bacterium]|nr:MFS transporter [Bdellovibrionales bacterium]MCB9086400.1 MFS transporter [Pseudobdellovibrionaceae bacterium]